MLLHAIHPLINGLHMDYDRVMHQHLDPSIAKYLGDYLDLLIGERST